MYTYIYIEKMTVVYWNIPYIISISSYYKQMFSPVNIILPKIFALRQYNNLENK